MDIHCESCGVVTALKQEYQYHAGFSNVGFLYCNRCPNLVVFHTYDADYRKVVGEVHPWSLTLESKELVEKALKKCTCGSSFSFRALPRCPRCNMEMRTLLEDEIHYVEIGRVFDGSRVNIWNSKDSGAM